MMDKFFALELPMQVFWGLAIISSAFFLVQTVMAFLGLDADTEDGAGFEDVEMDDDDDLGYDEFDFDEA